MAQVHSWTQHRLGSMAQVDEIIKCLGVTVGPTKGLPFLKIETKSYYSFSSAC